MDVISHQNIIELFPGSNKMLKISLKGDAMEKSLKTPFSQMRRVFLLTLPLLIIFEAL